MTVLCENQTQCSASATKREERLFLILFPLAFIRSPVELQTAVCSLQSGSLALLRGVRRDRRRPTPSVSVPSGQLIGRRVRRTRGARVSSANGKKPRFWSLRMERPILVRRLARIRFGPIETRKQFLDLVKQFAFQILLFETCT